MNAPEILSVLVQKGVKLWAEEDQLKYSAARGVMTPELLSLLGQNKRQILDFFRQYRADSEAGSAYPPLRRREDRGSSPLSFEQQRLWFLDQLSPGNAFYNVPGVVEVNGLIDPNILEQVLREIVRRHESLRTTFPTVNGEPVQCVADPATAAPLALPIADLSSLQGAAREAEAARIKTEEAARGFDLAEGPLLRVGLIKWGEQRWSFMLTLHHIVCDGWSMNVFSRELAVLYEAFAAGRPSPLPELPIQYPDFAVWQRQRLSGNELERQLSFWRQTLAGLAPLGLPTDRPRPRRQSYRGSSTQVRICKESSGLLRELGGQHGATSFMVLLAGFAAMLCRYTQQEDIAIGTYVANRSRPELEKLIGFFVNTLVLRIDLSGDPAFGELVGRVRQAALTAYAHQELPFSKLVEELHPERDLSRNPLFQVVLTLAESDNNRPAQPADLGPHGAEGDERPAIFDLVLDLAEHPGGFNGTLAYSTDLFGQATARNMAHHFETLTSAAVSNPNQRVSALPILTPSERRQLIYEWNETRTSYPDRPDLLELFMEWVARTPDAVALVYRKEQLTYSQLAAHVDRLAASLRAAGAGSESLVGVCLPRSFEAVIALLAVFKIGAAYLPLDPSYPRERLEFMLRDSGADAVIAREQAEWMQVKERPIIHFDLQTCPPCPPCPTEPPAPLKPDALAYVIYTSGSTGQPKGVAVEHRQILNRLYWMWREYPFTPGEVCCQKTALSFVDSIWEILGPLLRGVPNVIIPESDLMDLDTLVETLATHRVTRLWFVPSLLQGLLNAHFNLAQRLPCLKFWVSSGEPLTSDLRARFRDSAPHAVLYNLYGTSEVWDATWFDPKNDGETGAPPIGRPISNVRAYVLDPRLDPTPVGVYGELFIGGDGLARGYLNRPELTRERFLPDPFKPGCRIYKTGDIVRWRSDGNLEFLGRADGQIKLRGFRIEPAEIELRLRAHPAIEDAAVVAWPAPSNSAASAEGNDHRLTAYVSAKESMPSVQELKQWLRSALPEYMVPSVVVPMGAFPLTPSGKIDRRALPPPESGAIEPERAPGVPASTPTETALAELWKEVLGLSSATPVCAHDDFFRDLGGHSLLATQVMTRARDLFGVALPLGMIFDCPTLFTLARVVDETRSAAAITAVSGNQHTGDAASIVPGPIPRLARERYRMASSTAPGAAVGQGSNAAQNHH